MVKVLSMAVMDGNASKASMKCMPINMAITNCNIWSTKICGAMIVDCRKSAAIA
jgi:hypothetical protein